MRRPPAWKQVPKAIAGFCVGLALWLGFSAPYRSAVIAPAELVLNLSESPDITELIPKDDSGVIVNRADFPPDSPRPVVPLSDLTFNVILLFALFAISKQVLSNANVAGLGISLLILWGTHVAALAVRVKKIYALQLGAWSEVHYGTFSRNVWGSVDHFYRLVGMYAVAFALWWLLSGDNWKSERGRKKRG